jgi:hypothetical protein
VFLDRDYAAAFRRTTGISRSVFSW